MGKGNTLKVTVTGLHTLKDLGFRNKDGHRRRVGSGGGWGFSSEEGKKQLDQE